MHLIQLDSFLKKSQLQVSLAEIINKRIFKPRKDCEQISLSQSIDWESRHKDIDRNWRMQLQGWAIFFPIMNDFDGYNNKQELIEFFFEVMNDWYQNYGDDSNDIVTTRMPESYAWYDMSVGFRALVIAFFKNRLEYFELEATENQKNVLSLITKKHVLHLNNESVFGLNNHGMFQIQGLMALIQVSGVSNYQNEYQYALKKMEELVKSQFNDIGMHLEHSPHYHFYALTVFQKIVLNDWYDSKPIIKELIAKAMAVKKWLVDPLRRTACIGDSTLALQRNIDFKNNDFSSILEFKTNNGVLSNFSNSGYQIYRSGWSEDPKSSSYIFLMGMYNSKVHKHRDCLSFEWFESGEKVICDSGKYGYVSDEYRSYFLSHRAHNTVEIEGFDILNSEPYGSCLNQAQTYKDLILMSGEIKSQGITHHRELTIKPGSWIVVFDRLIYPDDRKTTQWFHPGLTYQNARLEDSRVILTSPNFELIINCLDKTLETQLYFGDDDYKQGFISEKDFKIDKAYAVGFSANVDSLEVNTILALSEEAEREALKYLSSFKGLNFMDKIVEEVPNRVLGNLINVNRTSFNRYDLLEGEYTYAYLFKNLRLNFYGHIKKNSKKLTIMLPGAVNRSKTIYNFQRHSWSDDVEGSVISFLDPTVSEQNDITIGWFQGDKDIYAVPVLIDFIKTILKLNDTVEENLTILGSSAGGFSALKIADSFLNSRIVAINPQTRVYNYFIKDYSKLVKWIDPELTPEQAKESYYERLKVTINIDKRLRPIEYYQNTADTHHVKHHLKPLLNSLNENSYESIVGLNQIFGTNLMLKVVYYTDPENGHSPPSKSQTITILNNV